jgi:hypothetical protein
VTTAAILLVVWYLSYYAYKLAPVEVEGDVWTMAGSAGRLLLLAALLWKHRVKAALLIGAGVAAEELQVIGCGVWWQIAPWVILPGQERCSERLGLPLGAVGITALGMCAAWWLGRKADGRPL